MNRTNTTTTTTFNLPPPAAVTMAFTAPSQIHITIPPLHSWHMPLHWHSNPPATPIPSSIKCLAGYIILSIADSRSGSSSIYAGGPGLTKPLPPTARIAWRRDSRHQQTPPIPLEVALQQLADDQEEIILFRNICSATLDRALYPHLASTPRWVKLLLLFFSGAPRERLLDLALWVQLQVMFFAAGWRLYRGLVPVTWPWVATQPFGGRAPQWARRLEAASMDWIAWVVGVSMYWVGRGLLGMQARYEEYTPARTVVEVQEKEKELLVDV